METFQYWQRRLDAWALRKFGAHAGLVQQLMYAAITGVAAGDQLIFRYTGLTGTLPMAWIPNGDGALAMGRIPFIELP